MLTDISGYVFRSYTVSDSMDIRACISGREEAMTGAARGRVRLQARCSAMCRLAAIEVCGFFGGSS